MKKRLSEYIEYMQKLRDIEGIIQLLAWDKEVNIIPESAPFRSRQIALMSKLHHQMFTDEKFGELLNSLLNDSALPEKQRRNIELTWKDYQRARRIPQEFIEEFSELTSNAFHQWHKAKKNKQFEIFAPTLERIIQMVIEKAKLLGFQGTPYNALLNEYEEGLNVEECNRIFNALKPQLKEIINKIVSSGKKINTKFLNGNFSIEKQKEFNISMALQLGFDMRAGNISISPHPFTTQISINDSRITTSYNSRDITAAIFSTIHEFGHAIYDSNLPVEYYGTPCGSSMGMVIHESQSRLWENNIGRSLPFWEYFFPILRSFFYEKLSNVSPRKFYEAINVVKPSTIRIYADEVTYHFHIIIRYEIEVDLIEGKISVNDIPRRWNSLYKEYLGVEPENDAEGCLQDIHWSHGSFGYFPTYSLGSMFAAMLYEKMKETYPDFDLLISKGHFSHIVSFLRENIYNHGRYYSYSELIKLSTGKELSPSTFMKYVKTKYSDIYEVEL